jgi:tRNA(Arg) A34 adenosine deaminase TadA
MDSKYRALSDEYFLQKAIALGRQGLLANKGGPFGAIVVLDGEIIGRGQNEVTSGNDPTAHAEVNAIRRACQRQGTFHLPGSVLYTSCEPCPMCLGAIYWAHIERVVFSTTRYDASEIAGFDDAHFYSEVMAPWNRRKMQHTQLLHEEGLRLFREWTDKKDKTMY